MLGKCIECGRPVSSEALFCPKCGRPEPYCFESYGEYFTFAEAMLPAVVLLGLSVGSFLLGRYFTGDGIHVGDRELPILLCILGWLGFGIFGVFWLFMAIISIGNKPLDRR